jgi:hypothetical protein
VEYSSLTFYGKVEALLTKQGAPPTDENWQKACAAVAFGECAMREVGPTRLACASSPTPLSLA